jgi:hypothetical protein
MQPLKDEQEPGSGYFATREADATHPDLACEFKLLRQEANRFSQIVLEKMIKLANENNISIHEIKKQLQGKQF